MEVSAKERQRAEHLLQSQRIQLHQIESFSFMKRYRRDPHENIAGGKDRYGPGLFVGMFVLPGYIEIVCFSTTMMGCDPAYAAFQTSVITRPLSCVARNTFRQLLSMQPE